MDGKLAELKVIFDYVLDHPGCTARQIGRFVPGGKSRANHFLYGYLDILFKKRGLTPPQWTVIAEEAFTKLVARAQPEVVRPPRTPSPFETMTANAGSVSTARDLMPITICQACELPIRPTGACGCS